MNKKELIDDENPYTALQKGWTDKLQRAERRNSQFAFGMFLLVLALFVSVTGNVYLSVFRSPVPYVLKVDEMNRATYAGHLTAENGAIKEDWVPSQLISFVENWRTVTPDNTLQKRMITNLYCMVNETDQSKERLNEYFREKKNNPFELNTKVSINTQISSILKQTSNTWIVEWTETVRELNGRVIEKPRTYKVNLLLGKGQPTNDCYEGNPLGLYVKQLDWTTVQKVS